MEYEKEYKKLEKEKNKSKLVCELLRKYYQEEEDKDMLQKIYDIVSNLKNVDYKIEEDEDFSIW